MAAFDYTGPVAAAIRTAKLGGAWSGWQAMGSQLAEVAAAVTLDADVVTWVTTSRRRAQRRGFDHAQLLADAVGRVLDLPCVRLLDVMEGRRADAFRVTKQLRLPGTHVLLVDDVLTTGVTASGAAQALKSAGAGTVTLGVVARAGRHDLHVAGVPG
ncbi:MAG: phosphoribosyltransferase family protein [Nitriliruptoraceae bacterium]